MGRRRRRRRPTSHRKGVAGRPIVSDMGPMSSGFGHDGRLWGRERECAELDALVSSVRRGQSRSLVLKGEAGIGKTALLQYVVGSATDFNIARAIGIESEMELAFAGLHQM